MSAYAQIPTISVAEKYQEKHITTKTRYDSTENCPKNQFSLLVNQEIYVLPLGKEEKDSGYKDFKTAKFNIKTDKRTAKRFGSPAINDKTRTKAEELENKIFLVKDIDHSNDSHPAYCLHLIEKGNPTNECKYVFEYASSFDKTFIAMSHYNYLKSQCIGKNFYFDNCCLPENDSRTGEKLNNRTLHSWNCKDIIISPESGQITMLLTYGNSETYLRKSSAVNFLAKDGVYIFYLMTLAYSEEEWNKKVEKYGVEKMFLVLNHKISIGMPFELVRSSIGLETKSNATSYGTQIYYKVNFTEFVRSKIIPYTYFQTGNSEMNVYLNENNVVTGWN